MDDKRGRGPDDESYWRRVELANLMIMSGEPYTEEDLDKAVAEDLARERLYPQEAQDVPLAEAVSQVEGYEPPAVAVIDIVNVIVDDSQADGADDDGVWSAQPEPARAGSEPGAPEGPRGLRQGQGAVFVEYHHALVVDPDDRTVDSDAGTPLPGGLVAPLSGGVGARIYTGVHTGTIAYTWTVHTSQPPADEPWAEEAQAVIGVPRGRLVVDGLFLLNVDAPVIGVDPPGAWVLRVRYRDRCAEWDSAPEADVAVETFHLDLWPAGR